MEQKHSKKEYSNGKILLHCAFFMEVLSSSQNVTVAILTRRLLSSLLISFCFMVISSVCECV